MTAAPALSRSIRRHLKAGIAVVLLLGGGVGGWAATTNIAGAVIASGTVVVDTNVKKVQHPTGGIVGELRVRDGQKVKAGEIVVRLDETVTRASLAIVTKGLSEIMARKARLEAERDGAGAVVFPDELAGLTDATSLKSLMAGERRLFEIRDAARIGQKAQLRQRIAQLEQEIAGLDAQQAAKAKEIVLIQRELDGARELWEKNLLPITRLTTLEREATRLEGERAQVVASTAQARGKIAEIELQIIQVDRDLSSEVGKELREIDAKIGEFVERKVTAEDQLKRIDIRAPQDGMVLQLSVHTVGGVITAGEAIMLIVPEADKLAVEARIGPQEIDQVRLGQKATLRFSAFNQATTPELRGELSRISADAVSDQRTGANFYVIRITLDDAEMARLGDLRLVPGMPVEAFVQTGERKVISYLVKPLRDQLRRAFRES
jgi:membrane fusion protein, type I secretion system